MPVTRFSRLIAVMTVLAAGASLSPAQSPSAAAAAESTRTPGGEPGVQPPRPVRAGVSERPPCATAPCSGALPGMPAQDSTVSRGSRGKYALAGLVVGAGVAWFVTWRACQKEECFGSGFGVLTLAGGALGLLVGLLLSPSGD